MDVLRRNTDYALRAVVNLAGCHGQQPVSTRDLAESEDIPYQLACKLMQKLHRAGMVDSIMGPQGGFCLNKAPSMISILEVVEAIQGPINLNRCLLGVDRCPREPVCAIGAKLSELQDHINDYLRNLRLNDLLIHKSSKAKRAKTNRKQ